MCMACVARIKAKHGDPYEHGPYEAEMLANLIAQLEALEPPDV